jgi:hypothetical protein
MISKDKSAARRDRRYDSSMTDLSLARRRRRQICTQTAHASRLAAARLTGARTFQTSRGTLAIIEVKSEKAKGGGQKVEDAGERREAKG